MKVVGLALLCMSVSVQADVCTDLKNVADQVGGGFSDWLGPYDSDLEEYAATYSLPGAGECIINTGEFPEYICRWTMSSDAQMNSQYQGLVADIASCTNLFPEKARVTKFNSAAGSTKHSSYKAAETSKFTSHHAPFEVTVRTKSSTWLKTGEQRRAITVAVSGK